MIKNNICFYVFHTEENKKNSKRNIASKNINDYASNYFKQLNSSTFKIVDDEGIINFLKNNKSFLIDPNGWDPSHRILLNSYKKETAKPKGWKYGYIGAWASNYSAWKNFLNTDCEYLLLFEDDVVLENNFFELMISYLNLLPDDWDVFHQYAPENLTNKTIKILDGKYPICKPYQSWSNAVYMLSRSGAEKAISEVESNPVFLPSDWFFFKQLNLFNMYTIAPGADMGCRVLDIMSSHSSNDFINISQIVNDLRV
jgi:GR25 family glycosyltransferase involved in LPS biosynthesis